MAMSVRLSIASDYRPSEEKSPSTHGAEAASFNLLLVVLVEANIAELGDLHRPGDDQ